MSRAWPRKCVTCHGPYAARSTGWLTGLLFERPVIPTAVPAPKTKLVLLRPAEAETAVAEICRKLEMSKATFFRWKRNFEGLGVSELRKLRQLWDENRKLSGEAPRLTHFLDLIWGENPAGCGPLGRWADQGTLGR